MATWSLTDSETTSEIDANALLTAFGFRFSGNYVKWSDTELTYTLNVGDSNPDGQTVAPWTQALTESIEMAHADIEAVSMIRFTEISDQVNGSDGADVDYWAYSQPNDNVAGYSYGVDGDGVFMDMADVYEPNAYTGDGLEYGGINYRTVIHEILHNLGMGHPHDGDAVLPGVSSSTDTGDFALNQNIYTVLSYNSVRQVDGNGEETTGYPFTFGTVDRSFGVLGTLDIAMLQVLYGANMDHATGNDVYEIIGENAAGTHYKGIWDAGGVDEFRYSGALDVRIDLRAATLDIADGMLAGGIVSKAEGIFGGLNIAHGTVIENATGGAGNDAIIGNGADNLLIGGAGIDDLIGGNGSDTLIGGSGADVLTGGEGNDVLDLSGSAAGVSVDLFLETGLLGDAEGDSYFSIENIEGSAQGDELYGDGTQNVAWGNNGNDLIHLGRGDDTLWGGDGDDTLFGGRGDDVINGGVGQDIINGAKGADTLDGGAGDDELNYANSLSGVRVDLGQNTASKGDAAGDLISNFENLTGSDYADSLVGSDGNNTIDGGVGRDTIDGGAGDDHMIGGLGRDTFIFDSGNDTIEGGAAEDIVIFDANAGDFNISNLENGSWQVIEISTSETNDFTEIEKLVFWDLTLLA